MGDPYPEGAVQPRLANWGYGDWDNPSHELTAPSCAGFRRGNETGTTHEKRCKNATERNGRPGRRSDHPRVRIGSEDALKRLASILGDQGLRPPDR